MIGIWNSKYIKKGLIKGSIGYLEKGPYGIFFLGVSSSTSAEIHEVLLLGKWEILFKKEIQELDEAWKTLLTPLKK